MKRIRSSFFTKIIVLAVAVYATVSLLNLYSDLGAAEEKRDALAEQVAELEKSNRKLTEDAALYGEEENVEQLARDKLGLVSQGELVFYDVSN